MLPTRDRIRGMFLGIAIGDALGVPVETYDDARIEREYGRITTYLQNPTHKWSATKPAGMWSDDTQLTLAVAESIIETGTLDLNSQATWHLRMLDEFGDLGLGGSTRDAFNRIRKGVSPAESGKTDNPKRGMGNALPMKIAPVGALFASLLTLGTGPANTRGWFDLIARVRDLTCMTHFTEIALQSALAHVAAVVHCLTSGRATQQHFIDTVRTAASNGLVFGLPHSDRDLDEQLAVLAQRNLDALTVHDIATLNSDDAFVVYNTLPLAYTCFLRHPTSMEGLYDAVAAGGDTDTNASIVGSLVGGLNGTTVFPARLVEGLAMRERILDTAERLSERLGIKE